MRVPAVVALFVVATVFALGSTSGFAACNSTSCTATIKRLYLDANFLNIQMATSLTPLAKSCKPVANRYLRIPTSHPIFSEWHGMLLAAFLSKRTATLRVNTDGRECRVGYVYMDN